MRFPSPNVDLGITAVSVLQNTRGSTLGRERAHYSENTFVRSKSQEFSRKFKTSGWRIFDEDCNPRQKSWNTCVCVFPPPVLIWALQRCQCFKIRVAQHWGGRGHITVRTHLWGVNLKNFLENSRRAVEGFLTRIAILVKNLETLVCAFSLPQCWFGHYSGVSASKYAWLNIGEGEGTLQWEHICEE